MKIGYACLLYGDDNIKYKTVQLKSLNNENLIKVIKNNLETLDKMLDYNVKNKIQMLRITSDLIPFGSSVKNELNWADLFKVEFRNLKEKIRNNNIRISMHPGQYTVLNSLHENVLINSINDLEYHAKVLDLLDEEAKIILHVGGVYGDKDGSMQRFIKNYNMLSERIKKRLVIENDDKSYTVDDVLNISYQTGIPVVFDNLHNKLNPSTKNEFELLDLCMKTWKGTPKMHYSNQDKNKKNGGHSKRIDTKSFLEFYSQIIDKNVDIMLEVKDKNISAIKCNILINHNELKYLELEWAKYKYLVMQHSHKDYLKIRELMNEEISASVFYSIIDECLEKEIREVDYNNSLLHVWCYFKNMATETEKKKFHILLKVDKDKAKKHLHKLAIKYNVTYLLNSYYYI